MHDGIGTILLLNGQEQSINKLEEISKLLSTESFIYEVIRVVDSVPLFFDDYVQRLANSFSIMKKSLPIPREKILQNIRRLLEVNHITDGPVKMIFGVDQNPIILFYIMKAHLPETGGYELGVKTILLFEERNNPNAKVWNASLRKRSVEAVREAGAYEAILVNQKGFLTEGSRSNLFFIKEHNVITCPDEYILPGITRKRTLEILNSRQIEVVYEAVHHQKMNEYEAAFLTGTSRKIVPVKSMGAVEFDVKNETLKLVMDFFDAYVNEWISTMKESFNYHL